MQDGINRIIRRVERLKAGIDWARDQLVENLQLDLHNSIKTAFVALETSTTTHHGRLGGSVHTAATSITDGSKALM